MVLTEFIQANPKTSIILISIVMTIFSTLITKWLTNQEHLKSLKARQKELQVEMKKHKDNPKMMEEIQMEMMKITGVMMKSSFKPLLVTMVPFLLIFTWIRGIYGGEVPLLNYWFWWYFGSAIVSSLIFRKVFDMA